MRFGDIKIVVIDFYSYEIGALETYLEEMALKGWMLEKISNLYIKFRKIEPKNIKYTIDIIDGILEKGDLDENLALEYKEKFLNLGWNYSCEFNKLQVFYKENEDRKSIIRKRENKEIQALFHNSLNELILRTVFISFILLIQLKSIFKGENLNYFTNNASILGLSILVIFISTCLIDLYKLIKFRLGNNKEKSSSTLWIRFKGSIITIIFLTAIIGVITILFENNKEDFDIKLIILSIISGLFLLGYFIENKKDSIKKKLTISSCFIITIVSIVVLNNFLVSNIFKNKSNGVKSKQYSLSLEDFNDEVSREEDIYVDEESSFIANKLFYTANGKKMKLSYELFESDYRFMVNWNFNKMMNWFEKQGICYNEIKTNLPNEVKVYTNEEENNYIILSLNKVIEVIGLYEINDKEEVLNVVYNKIFINKKEEVV